VRGMGGGGEVGTSYVTVAHKHRCRKERNRYYRWRELTKVMAKGLTSATSDIFGKE
jgi:hypothetical protein